LEDYVSVPAQASEIGMIVGIAAKIYAQRLIAEAAYLQKKDMALFQQQQQQTGVSSNASHNTNVINNNTSSAMDTETDDDGPSTTPATTTTTTKQPRINESIHSQVLLCTYVQLAVQERQRRNVDPGFFISSSSSSHHSTSMNTDYNVHQTTSHQLYEQRRLAAMAIVNDKES
jgi:hypothetical protein